MNIHQFLNLMGKKKQTFASMLIIFVAIAVIFSAVQPFKYDSNMKLLTIISFNKDVDPYTASRSNEYLSGLLANIVSSGSFLEKIKSSGFKIDNNYFQGTEKQQIKKWTKTVKAKSVADTGIISVDVYHTDRAQAEEIARAVAYTLQTTNSQYHGFGDGVTIKIIDQPITSNYPVQPNLLLNLALAVAFALIFSLCYIYLFPEEKYDLRLWPKKERAVSVGFDSEQAAKSTGVLSAVEAEDAEAEALAYPEENITNGYEPSDYQTNGSMNNILPK
jgi:capsular polysaccharide biosynthesis protein